MIVEVKGRGRVIRGDSGLTTSRWMDQNRSPILLKFVKVVLKEHDPPPPNFKENKS